jgi:hypothetical protein
MFLFYFLLQLTIFFHAHEGLEHLEQESHALWAHIEIYTCQVHEKKVRLVAVAQFFLFKSLKFEKDENKF